MYKKQLVLILIIGLAVGSIYTKTLRRLQGDPDEDASQAPAQPKKKCCQGPMCPPSTRCRRAAKATCYYTRPGYCEQLSGESCERFKDEYTAGSCAAKGYAKRCKLRYGIPLWYKTDAECKAAMDMQYVAGQ